MSNVSDQRGRALETVITSKFIDTIPDIKVLGNTYNDQQRDDRKVQELPAQLRGHFSNGACVIFNWFTSTFTLNPEADVSIERLSDDVAKKGDPTDIRVTVDDKIINLSIKHNHKAVKHQRPGALAQQCGYRKNTLEDKTYRLTLKRIIDDFLLGAKALKLNATKFNELKAQDSAFINTNLYQPVCNLVAGFINANCSREENAQYLFDFLVGKVDFYKLILTSDSIEISAFAKCSDVTSVRANQTSDSYIDLEFSNSWILSMRLHTASSRIKGVSLKFDTQPNVMPVPQTSLSLR